MSIKPTTRSALALSAAISAAVSSQAFAAGFALNEQSVSGMGTAYAGRAAGATNDATVVYGNPAAMSLLDRPELTAGFTYIKASTDISNASATDTSGNTVTGSSDGDMVPAQYVPYMYYVNPVNEKLALGFGIYVPFGLAGNYEDDFVGRYFAKDSEMMAVNFQPTISYKFNDQWSIGAGVYASYIEATLSMDKNEIYNIPIIGSAGFEGYSEVEGDDISWGYNIGVLYQPTDKTRLGLTYHSKTDYTLEGKAHVTGILDKSFLGKDSIDTKAKGHVDLITPESVDFAITHQLNDRWTLMAGATWTRWSRFNEIDIIADEDLNIGSIPAYGPGDTLTYVNENWKDSMSYAIGATYQLNDQWLLRAGYAIDESPIPSENLTARIPSGDRQWFAVGAQWKADNNITVDMALAYLKEDKISLDEHLYDSDSHEPDNKTSYKADYENSGIGIGVQVSYKF